MDSNVPDELRPATTIPVKVLILCGGRGIIDPETRQRIPKGLLLVGGRPLLWHVMKIFAAAGVVEFVLALGEGGEAIRRYFLYQYLEGRDVEFQGGTSEITYLTPSLEDNWRVRCVDTGFNAQTGSRIARCRRYLEGETFFMTYSDCLCNVDLTTLLATHRARRRTVTVTGVQPPSRFGTFSVDGQNVISYNADARLCGIGGYLNGGFMAMEPGIFDRLRVVNECNLERDVFPALAAQGDVAIFPHGGYWQAVDTERDLQVVTHLYTQNKRPWLSLGPCAS